MKIASFKRVVEGESRIDGVLSAWYMRLKYDGAEKLRAFGASLMLPFFRRNTYDSLYLGSYIQGWRVCVAYAYVGFTRGDKRRITCRVGCVMRPVGEQKTVKTYKQIQDEGVA